MLLDGKLWFTTFSLICIENVCRGRTTDANNEISSVLRFIDAGIISNSE